MAEQRKQAVSIRLGESDIRNVKRIAKRLEGVDLRDWSADVPHASGIRAKIECASVTLSGLSAANL